MYVEYTLDLFWRERGKEIIFLQGDQPTTHLKSCENPLCLRLGTPETLVSAGFSWNRSFRNTSQENATPLWPRNYPRLRISSVLFFPPVSLDFFPDNCGSLKNIPHQSAPAEWSGMILGKRNETKTPSDLIKSIRWILVISSLYPVTKLSTNPSTGSKQSLKHLWSLLNSGMFFMFSVLLRSVRKTNSSLLLLDNNPLMELHSLQELCTACAFAKYTLATF